MGLRISKEVKVNVLTEDGKPLVAGKAYVFFASDRWCFGVFNGVNNRGYLNFCFDRRDFSLSVKSIEKIVLLDDILAEKGE